MSSPLLALVRLIAYLAVTFACVPVQGVLLLMKSPARETFPRAYHRMCAWILGFRFAVNGHPDAAHPCLFVSNHTSYLDIIVLGALIDGCFVAKTEVSGWPFFGPLSKLQRTVYVDRKRASAGRQRDSIVERLGDGGRLILFPEGTSSDGNRTLPFRSALFAVASTPGADGRPLTVQPISLACTHLDGWPLGRNLRWLYSWYGDMDLLSHIWRVAGIGSLTITVTFHAPVTVAEFGSRKALASYCENVVADGVAAALSGRPMPEHRHRPQGAPADHGAAPGVA